METEAGTRKRKRTYVSAEARFFEKLGNGVLEARFRKLPQGSDSDSGSEAGSGRPMKLPCNVVYDIKIAVEKFSNNFTYIISCTMFSGLIFS
ncbi:unnamed protein product [Brassica oleracea]|uniref:(rape) hypothetical protein n=1 Tax=Brassica napus TaxID=3708 RepID=A0A816KW15_BRANA|nr:unnamed protein product [Brassica napus]